ncbi:MAG: DNA-processing protein DprA [Phycisphaerae bacterium]|nr:DNA-processing protein DprA [Phycisphaerae bacterium]
MAETISDAGRAHLRWAMVSGVGPIAFRNLLDTFGDAEKAWTAPAAELQNVRRIGIKGADRICSSRREVEIDDEIATAVQHGVRIICSDDTDYPEALKRIPDAPIVLYVKGELRPTDAVALAVVGTRRCSIHASEQARRFGELLAQAGFTVVSGLARGIDAFAQHGAVDAGGRSIAVLGNGLADIYPPENRALADKLVEHGALVTELPMRSAVQRENFPGRNRIIAGLSLGTLVIEAPQRSGALITARLANDYNREVFALPGRVQDPIAQGTNELIRDGIAKLVTDLTDITDELGDLGTIMQPQPTQPHDEPKPPPPAQLNTVEARVLGLIGADPRLQDEVLRAAGLPPGDVLAAFTSLELKGLVRRMPGQYIFRRGK